MSRAPDNNPDVNQLYIERFSVKPLASLEGNLKYTNQTGVLFSHVDYLTLVDTTGRIQRQGKRGFTSDTILPILQLLAFVADEWLENTQNYEMLFYKIIITDVKQLYRLLKTNLLVLDSQSRFSHA